MRKQRSKHGGKIFMTLVGKKMRHRSKRWPVRFLCQRGARASRLITRTRVWCGLKCQYRRSASNWKQESSAAFASRANNWFTVTGRVVGVKVGFAIVCFKNQAGR